MARIVTSYNNFARAQIDHDMSGRYDLPIYKTGADLFRNFISNFKGNAIYRTGLEDMVTFQDCAFVEFKFSSTQTYIVVMFANKFRFLSYDTNGNFGWVLDVSSNILEVATPYTLAESKIIARGKPAQNSDVMVFCHNSYQPYKLTRTSANSFTFVTFARLDDPFGLTYDTTKTITSITAANPAVVTSTAHGYSTGDMVKFAGVGTMTQINNYTARVTVLTANTYSVDIDASKWTAGSGGTTAKLLTGDFPACSLFYRGRLYYARSRLKVTTTWGSQSGAYDTFTLPATVTSSSALQFTIADISQQIEWLFGGDNSLIVGSADGIVAVNGGSVGSAIAADTIQATLSSADGCNYAYPLKKDGFIFYLGIDGRNLYNFAYDLLTETFKADDVNTLSYDITNPGMTKIRYKKDRNNLIYALRSDGDMLTCNFNQKEAIVGWHEHVTNGIIQDEAVIGDNTGKPHFFALVVRNGVYFIERQAEYIQFGKRVNFFTGKTQKAADDEAFNRYIAEQLKDCIYLDNSQTVANPKTSTITFNGTDTISASAPSFAPGDVGKHIVYQTATGYESGRFEILHYNSNTSVTVDVLQIPTTNVYSSWYLSFSTITGLTQYNGQTIGVVTDGGYLDDFLVSGGAIDLGDQYTSVVLGYRYKGIIKSFSLGFAIQGNDTQTTAKAIKRCGVRCVTSAGGQFGSSLYRLEDVQELTQSDLNYLPPLPIDGTKYIDYIDDNELDKYFYLVQDAPLPFQAVAVIIEANYTISS